MGNPINIDNSITRKLRLASYILVTLAVAGGVAYQYNATVDAKKRVSSAPATPPLAIPVSPPSPLRVDTSPPAPREDESRAQQFDRLARGTPEESLQALKLLQPCEDADFALLELAAPTSDNDDPAFRSQQNAKVAAKLKAFSASCDGITAGQRTQSIPLAIKAAQAKVPGAFEALTRLEYRSTFDSNDREGDPRDPRIVQAMPAIWDAYIKAGDPAAILARYQRVSNCPNAASCNGYDPRMSLVLWTMYVDSGSFNSTDFLTPKWVQMLDPEVARGAILEGHTAYAARGTK